jgi:hypothetical protein
MATVTDLATVALATAAGYQLTTYATPGGTNTPSMQVAILQKRLAGATGTTGGVLEGVGESASLTTAKTNALAALNAARRHRYAGSPGAASGATVVKFSDGLATIPVVDSN